MKAIRTTFTGRKRYAYGTIEVANYDGLDVDTTLYKVELAAAPMCFSDKGNIVHPVVDITDKDGVIHITVFKFQDGEFKQTDEPTKVSWFAVGE